MIDIKKKYRTRDGREVKLFYDNLNSPHPILGAVHTTNGWIAKTWSMEGKAPLSAILTYNSYDLIEVNKRQELLDEAKRRYPVGTRFIGLYGHVETSKMEPYFFTTNDNIAVRKGSGVVYYSGSWAEVIEAKDMTVEEISKELGYEVRVVK